MTRVIEPSEIITGRDESPRFDPVHANPWLRFIARYFDYTLFFLLLYAIPFVHFSKVDYWIPLEYLAYIPVETLLLWAWGTTPGKWLLRIQMRAGHRSRLPFDMALKRSFFVWLRGLGLAIPVITAFCMLNAYYRLKTLRTTSWDRDLNIYIEHLPIAKWRFYTVTALTFVGMIVFIGLKNSWF